MTGVGQGRGNFISFLADVFRLNSPTIFTSVFTRLPRAKKKIIGIVVATIGSGFFMGIACSKERYQGEEILLVRFIRVLSRY